MTSTDQIKGNIVLAVQQGQCRCIQDAKKLAGKEWSPVLAAWYLGLTLALSTPAQREEHKEICLMKEKYSREKGQYQRH